MRARAAAALLVTLIAVLALAAPALAGTGTPNTDNSGRISVDGGLFIGADERIDGLVVAIDGDVRIDGDVDDDVYVVGGDAVINGRVHEDILVIGGDVRIDGGRVDGDVVAVGGRVVVKGEGALVDGDVRSTDEPIVRDGSRVRGDTDKLGFDGMFGSVMFSLLAFLWLAVTVSGALLGLLYVWLFPKAAAASVRAGSDVARSIAWGVGVAIVGPVLAVVTTASLIGLPFGFGLGAALVALCGLGYVTSALCLGRRMVKASDTGGRIGAFFAGFGILRAAAIVPGLGALIGLLATVYGLGVLANAAWRAGRNGRAASDDTSTAPAAPATVDTADEASTDDDAGADDTEAAPVAFKADDADATDDAKDDE